MNDKPIKTFRDAEDRAVAASIWLVTHAESGQLFYDVTLSRAWRDQATGDSGYSQNFSDRNLDGLIRVLRDAQAWIQNARRNAETDAVVGQTT